MQPTHHRLLETRHALAESEREIERLVLTKMFHHMSRADRPIRESYDMMISDVPLSPDVSSESFDEDGVRGWWMKPERAAPGRAILFLHGGGYCMGSAKAYRGFASQLALRAKVNVFVLDYPLAPEHPFPAAYDTSVAARRWLAAQGVDRIALVGDSAGGGLALAIATEPETKTPPIASVVVFSPCVDLALTGASLSDPAIHDPIFKLQNLRDTAGTYLNGADPKDGRASPLYAISTLLPPLAIQVGSDELLLDDARRYAAAAADLGGEIQLDVFEGLHHVFQLAAGTLPTASRALDDAVMFISRHW